MLAQVKARLARKYVALQMVVLLLWLGVEATGLGPGLLAALTDAEGWHLRDVLGAPAPPGPIRLDYEERRAAVARLERAFGGQVPQHIELAEMGWHYELAPGALCAWQRRQNIAFDRRACNRLTKATPIFAQLLQAMHPRTQHLYWEEAAAKGGGSVRIAFFVGIAGKPQILIDLSRVSSATWDLGQGVTMKAAHGGGTGATEIPLGAALSGGVHIIEDPGSFQRREPCDKVGCLARLILYGIAADDTRDSMGRPARKVIADMALTPALERRFAFFAALLDAPTATAPVARVETKFKVESFAVTELQLVPLQRKLDAALGAGSFERARFAAIGYYVAFGKVLGLALDGSHYLIWDGGPPHPSLGTDRFVFCWNTGGQRTPISDVRRADGLYALPVAPSRATGTDLSLTVHKAIDADGRPWSEFEDMASLFATLGGRAGR